MTTCLPHDPWRGDGVDPVRSVELSIAAKITRVLSSDGSGGHRPGYGAKIGDFSGGSWMDYDPQKHEAKVRALARSHGG